ncbi:MAG: hypothetical protein A2W09_02890 [Deltaproteobacteria bacterium RBG_16_50_11]|nr:MAG: hypothetical protein A2W09_02890 [Deltaproteobacteria bacterium RBG_16_50_11]
MNFYFIKSAPENPVLWTGMKGALLTTILTVETELLANLDSTFLLYKTGYSFRDRPHHQFPSNEITRI